MSLSRLLSRPAACGESLPGDSNVENNVLVKKSGPRSDKNGACLSLVARYSGSEAKSTAHKAVTSRENWKRASHTALQVILFIMCQTLQKTSWRSSLLGLPVIHGSPAFPLPTYLLTRLDSQTLPVRCVRSLWLPVNS